MHIEVVLLVIKSTAQSVTSIVQHFVALGQAEKYTTNDGIVMSSRLSHTEGVLCTEIQTPCSIEFSWSVFITYAATSSSKKLQLKKK